MQPVQAGVAPKEKILVRVSKSARHTLETDGRVLECTPDRRRMDSQSVRELRIDQLCPGRCIAIDDRMTAPLAPPTARLESDLRVKTHAKPRFWWARSPCALNELASDRDYRVA
jgi:hypothetical protein